MINRGLVKKMNSRPTGLSNRGLVIRLVGSLIALSLLFILLSKQGWKEIVAAISQIPWWQIGLALILTLISRLAVSGRWHVLLRSAGINISFKQTMKITFAGLFASNFLPTTIGGDVIRLSGAIQLKFDGSICAASLVVDRLVGMAGMALAAPLGMPGFTRFIQFPLKSISQPGSFLSLGLIPLNNWIILLHQKVAHFISNVAQALSAWIHNPRSLFLSLVFTWLHMLCLFASIAIILDGMNDPMSFWLIAGLWSLVYFITLIPISINGYGLQELSMALIFTQVGGISHQSGLTVALLVRTLTLFASLPGATFIPGILSSTTDTSNPN
jgi:uncharacterized membrane protein YbhN (UPF0104 family)